MSSILMGAHQFMTQLSHGLWKACIFVSLFWIIHGLNVLSRHQLKRLGIIPREPLTLILGPWCSTLIHADFNHLVYNSFPLVCLSSLLFAQGTTYAISTMISISLLKSLFVWVIGRRGIHIGASGLVVGLFSYFLTQGYYEPGLIPMLTAFIVFYYFGSLLFSIFPQDLLTSYEGHLSGMISGIVIYLFGSPQEIIWLSSKLVSML